MEQQIPEDDLTLAIRAAASDPNGASELLPLLYDELRRLAEVRLAGERPGQTLQATALVHEAYMRLLGPDPDDPATWDGRGHFFAAAAEAMRRILIDRARARGTLKRGGSARRLRLDAADVSIDEVPAEILDLDEALQRLHTEDPPKAELVRLRFYAGLTLRQAADVLGISPSTADRYWSYARAWLYSELSDAD